MIVVSPETRTTLLLNRNFTGFAFANARATIRHLMTGRGKGIDASGNPIGWDTEGVGFDWHGNKVEMFEDQPALRSAPNSVTGEDTLHAIPTILLCLHHFGFKKKGGTSVSLRALYTASKGVCQYCLEKVPFSVATKDHIYPKSKGGSNDDFNLVLACKTCNNLKDSIFPYLDVNGNEVKPLKISTYQSFIPENMNIREEWKPFLFST